jgi:hypothetical protein
MRSAETPAVLEVLARAGAIPTSNDSDSSPEQGAHSIGDELPEELHHGWTVARFEIRPGFSLEFFEAERTAEGIVLAIVIEAMRCGRLVDLHSANGVLLHWFSFFIQRGS